MVDKDLSTPPHLSDLTVNIPYHTETIQLIWSANQLTGFYVMGNTGR